MRLGSLFSGYSGLELGIGMVLPVETAWVADNDPGAARILAHRFPGIPNLGDVTAVDWTTVESVDVLCGGFPCQPISHAGKQLGDQDERWLWNEVVRAVCALRPQLVVLENVRALLGRRNRRLFGRVLADLADAGYDAEWTCLRASDVGAPHRRDRVFVAAHPENQRHQWSGRSWIGWPRPADGRLLPIPTTRDTKGRNQRGDRSCLTGALLPTPAVNDMGEGKSVEAWDEWTAAMQVRHAIEVQRADRWGVYADAIARWEALTRPAPAPTEPTGRGGTQRLSPRFPEWMMGLPEGWVTDVPGITRREALRAIGNGVVPQQAAAALSWLLSVEVAA